MQDREAHAGPPSLIIFDLDGTLIDSAPDIARAINHALLPWGCSPLTLPEVKLMIGDGAPSLVERALAARDLPMHHHAAALDAFVEYYDTSALDTELYPGVSTTLAELYSRGTKLAVCTNKRYQSTILTLERLRLAHYFEHIVGGNSLPFRKPDPRMLRSVMTRLNVAPTSSLMVGDSAIDSAAALAAGVPFVFVTYGYHRNAQEEINCVARIDTFPELTEFLSSPSADRTVPDENLNRRSD
jgi:phosphoglycolate phosphatase